MKKIHVIVRYFYPVAAGIETNILETYSDLAEKGYEICIHTSADTLTEKGVLKDDERIRGLNIIRYKYSWWSFWPKIDWKNADIVALHNFDVIPHLFILLFSLWLKIRGRKRFALILTPHGGFTPEWTIFGKIQAWIKRAYHYSLGSIMINLVIDGVRAVSEWERKEIIAKGVRSDLVETISNGLEDEAFLNVDREASVQIKSRIKSLGRYVLQIGRVYPIKNYETTIRALRLIPRDIKFVIVGPVADERYNASLIELSRKCGVADRVIFLGVIRGVDKYYVISKAVAMVHMALWESFCNVVHEGMSQGLICVVADNTALTWLVKEGVNGFRVETRDHVALARILNDVISQFGSAVMRRIRRRNIEWCKGITWGSVALKMERFYLKRFLTLNVNRYETEK